jgi:23S rRNA pseudouridine955/2504/2580 synthase
VTVAAALKRNQVRGGERIVTVDSDDGKPSVSRFRPLETFRDASFMEVVIETGRTHQIRVHAAHLGHQVVGDGKYGDGDVNKRFRTRGFKRMFLHAASLTLPHPNGDTLSVSAPLDDEMRALVTELEGGPR